MLWERALLLALPGLDQEQRQRTGGVDREASDAWIDPPEALFTPMGVTTMRSQRTDAFRDRRQAAQNLADVALYFSG